MTSYASVEELAVLCPTYTESQRERAEALLPFVSAAMDALCDTSEVSNDVLKFVCCQATGRALQAGQDAPIGVTQTSWGASPFSQSMTFANPTGDIYFTSIEKKMLGIGTGTAGFINCAVGGTDD